jgi:hypothetical protein
MGFPALIAAADGAVLSLLGGPVRYSAIPEGPYTDVVGIFDEQYQRADVSDVSVSATAPAVFLSLADIAPLDPDTDQLPTVTVNAKTYRVRESKKDGLGGVVLMLQEASY